MNCERNIAVGRITSYVPGSMPRLPYKPNISDHLLYSTTIATVIGASGVEKFVMSCFTQSAKSVKFGFFKSATIWPLFL